MHFRKELHINRSSDDYPSFRAKSKETVIRLQQYISENVFTPLHSSNPFSTFETFSANLRAYFQNEGNVVHSFGSSTKSSTDKRWKIWFLILFSDLLYHEAAFNLNGNISIPVTNSSWIKLALLMFRWIGYLQFIFQKVIYGQVYGGWKWTSSQNLQAKIILGGFE